MSEKRLFLSVSITIVETEGALTNNLQSEVGWYVSADEARGASYTRAVEKHPEGKIDSINVVDVTDIAAEGFCP